MSSVLYAVSLRGTLIAKKVEILVQIGNERVMADINTNCSAGILAETNDVGPLARMGHSSILESVDNIGSCVMNEQTELRWSDVKDSEMLDTVELRGPSNTKDQ